MASKNELVKQIGVPENKLDPFVNLAKQCQAEYDLAWKHQKPEKDEAEARLKLYNNQKRKKKNVGDTTMFTIHQTILASLYVDRLDVTFGAREAGDEEVAENLTAMAEFDYPEMEKDILDYDWDWDALFFGRGLMELSEYERDPKNKIYLPIPQVVDPIPFMRDPFCTSINGDRRGGGAARFFGSEVMMTRADLEKNPNIFDDIDFKEIKHSSGTKSVLGDTIVARVEAQGQQDVSKEMAEEALGSNAYYTVTKWNTHFEVDGTVKKVRVYLANDRSKVIGVKVLKDKKWTLIDRPLYPHSHDWRGTSIPDLTEDKQRARAVAQNLGLQAMKADLYPSYIYDSSKITNRRHLKFGFNKFIPVDGKGNPISGVIEPMIKARPNMGLLDFIYTSLDASAQKATATPEIQQGAMSEAQRTLGELNLISSKVDTRYSLSAKVFGWSEKRFWSLWYQSYKTNFQKDIDEKVLRIVGAFGAKWRPLGKDNIIANTDPDIIVESRNVSRARQLEQLNSLSGYFTVALADPTANRRWGLKKLGKLNGLEKDELERLFPPTIDERIAEDENEFLSDDKIVQVSVADDHNVHLEIHAKAADTDATYAHIETHKKALSIKKTNPELFPVDQTAATFTEKGTPNLPAQGGAAPAQPAAPIAPSQTSNAVPQNLQ